MIDRTACESRHRWLQAIVIAMFLSLLMSQPASAAVEPVGRMISAAGDVTAIRAGESARSLNRGDAVYEGDELRTGARASAQVRFSDGGLFALEADTRFAVNEYETEDDGGGSAVMQFLRGALRTITGTIGGQSGDTYRLRTPTATIGVRGTSYALSYCDAECAAGHDGQPGLYGRVGDGGVSVDTSRGTGRFGAGSYFFVPEGGAARAILKPPKGILDGEAAERREEAGEAITAAAAGGALPSREEAAAWLRSAGITGVVFESGDTFTAGGGSSTGIGGAAVAFSAGGAIEFFPAGGAFTTDGSGNVNGAQFSGGGPDVQVTTANLDESGIETDLGISWGRWSGGFDVGGVPVTGQNMAFAVTDNFTQPTTLGSLSGTINYSNPVGPSAFDGSGALWAVDALSLGVDFGAGDFTVNQFSLNDGVGVTIDFDNTSTPSGEVLDLANNQLELRLLNISGDFAEIRGRFVGGAAEGMIVVFQVNEFLNRQITGTKILRAQ